MAEYMVILNSGNRLETIKPIVDYVFSQHGTIKFYSASGDNGIKRNVATVPVANINRIILVDDGVDE